MRENCKLINIKWNFTMNKSLNKSVKQKSTLFDELSLIIAEIIGINEASADDDFFQIGGDSMSAISLVHEIEKQYGVKLPLATLFNLRKIKKIVEKTASLIKEQD